MRMTIIIRIVLSISVPLLVETFRNEPGKCGALSVHSRDANYAANTVDTPYSCCIPGARTVQGRRYSNCPMATPGRAFHTEPARSALFERSRHDHSAEE